MTERVCTAIFLGGYLIVMINILVSIFQYKSWISQKKLQELSDDWSKERCLKFYWRWFATLWVNMIVFLVLAFIVKNEKLIISGSMLLGIGYSSIVIFIYESIIRRIKKQ